MPMIMLARVRSVARLGTTMLVALSALVGGTACDGGGSKPVAPREPSELFWRLELDQHAALLSTTAPYDTLTVVATPRNYQGNALAGLPAPQFTSSDPTVISVSPSGVLTASRPGTVSIVATVVSNNLRHADTIQAVAVDDPAPVALGSLSIHPIAPDSAKTSICSTHGSGVQCVPLRMEKLIRLTDAVGQPYPWQAQAPVGMRIADTTMGRWYNGSARPADRGYHLIGKQLGRTEVYASVVAFGVVKADTLSVRFGLPLYGAVEFVPAFSDSQRVAIRQPAITLGIGGVAFFALPTFVQTDQDIVFDDITNVGPISALRWQDDDVSLFLSACALPALLDCGAGNIRLGKSAGASLYAFRTFNVPGVYKYHSTQGGGGEIIVQEDPAESP